ncbi:hypothetical protein C240_584 [Enterococcus sp. 5H]|nr:hypothetical protein [Enterococcus sp. 5H]
MYSKAFIVSFVSIAWVYVYNSVPWRGNKDFDIDKITRKERVGIYLLSFTHLIQVIFSCTMILMSLGKIINQEELTNILSQLILLIYILSWYISLMELLSRLKKGFFMKLILFCAFLGAFKSEWWTGIAIITSLSGIVLSDEFIKNILVYNSAQKKTKFWVRGNIITKKGANEPTLNKKLKEKIMIYKFLIPFLTWIMYVSLIVQKDVVPEKLKLKIFTLLGLLGDSKELSDNGIAKFIINGAFIMLIFSIIYIFLIKFTMRFAYISKIATLIENEKKEIVGNLKKYVSRGDNN